MSYSVSLIIPTKNRSSDLEHTLESVFGQRILPAQLIIVDQGQGDETKKRVENLFAETRFPVREKVQFCYIRDTMISGLTVARNRAMEVARGDICLRSFERKLLCDRGQAPCSDPAFGSRCVVQ